MELCPGKLFLHPKPEFISLVRCQFIPSEEYAYGFQREAAGWGLGIRVCFPNCLFCMVVHLAIELCAPREALIPDVVVLVGLHVGENSGEG